MKKSLVIILAGIVFVTLIAAGCTNAPGLTPVTPAATTVVPTPTLQVTTATPAPQSLLWSGTWNTTYGSKDMEPVTEVLTLKESGSTVTGTYHAGKGTINATVQGGTLTGTWYDSDTSGTYSGFFVFKQSVGEKSFTGRWVSTAEGADALINTTQFWNGVMLPSNMAAPSASEPKVWSGVWNTTWLGSDGNLTLSSISMTQEGSVVSGIYRYTIPGGDVYNGTLTAAVHGNKIAGNYSESDNDTGVFEFELSADHNSFTGRWAHASAGEGALNNSTLFWNGIRK
jgi:hypothetical protein